MKMLFENAVELADGIWKVSCLPEEMDVFGVAKSTSGERTVLLAHEPVYDRASGKLWFERNSTLFLNLGTKSDTLVIGARSSSWQSVKSEKAGRMLEPVGVLGAGDKEFLDLVDVELRGEANLVGKKLLQQVRESWPGDLKKGLRNNFSNEPDNFWYVVVQPRIQELSITVRGKPSKFQPSSIELKDDRPGYTRFKLAKLADLHNALAIIAQSSRRQ